MPAHLQNLLPTRDSAVGNRTPQPDVSDSNLGAGDGRVRIVIEGLRPEIDAGRFPIKRTLGEEVRVQADIFADGHDFISAVIKHRHDRQEEWSETPLRAGVNDRWSGSFAVTQLGTFLYTSEAWINPFRSWARDLEKKFAARVDVEVELLAGVELIRAAAARAVGADQLELQLISKALAPESLLPCGAKVAAALSGHVANLVDAYSDRLHAATCSKILKVTVDPVLARFGSWYELFPRSCAPLGKRHGTLKDCEAVLPRIANMGFDIAYLPPVHPIGGSFRKGKNNALTPGPDDPGSPWAIGSADGGHKSIHPELGHLGGFSEPGAQRTRTQLEIALDIAFQCSPDHPYVTEHPEWFRRRPDGSIQYAENPPKKYQDIYPLNFECDDWQALWAGIEERF